MKSTILIFLSERDLLQHPFHEVLRMVTKASQNLKAENRYDFISKIGNWYLDTKYPLKIRRSKQ